MPETSNGKVTLAIIGTKLDLLLASNHEMRLQLDAVQSCQDKLAYIPDTVRDLEKKVNTLETDMTVLKTRTGVIGGIDAALAIIGSAISGFLGTR